MSSLLTLRASALQLEVLALRHQRQAHRWTANLRILEIDEIKTVPHVSWAYSFVERLIGTVRREFLDQVLFWNARDLERKLTSSRLFTTRHAATHH